MWVNRKELKYFVEPLMFHFNNVADQLSKDTRKQESYFFYSKKTLDLKNIKYKKIAFKKTIKWFFFQYIKLYNVSLTKKNVFMVLMICHCIKYLHFNKIKKLNPIYL